MPTKDDFTSRYSGKWRERYNKAIRAEVPGGEELLGLLELVSKARFRGRIDNPLDFARIIEDRLQDARDAMVAAIQGKYQIQPKDTD